MPVFISLYHMRRKLREGKDLRNSRIKSIREIFHPRKFQRIRRQTHVQLSRAPKIVSDYVADHIQSHCKRLF